MRASIRHIVIALSFLILATPLFCQNTILYTYDSTGNRIARVTSAGNIASTIERPLGFHQVPIASNIMSSGTIHVLEHKWQSYLMRFYAHKSSRPETDSRILTSSLKRAPKHNCFVSNALYLRAPQNRVTRKVF